MCGFSLQHKLGEKKCLIWKNLSEFCLQTKDVPDESQLFCSFSPALHAVCQRTGSGGDFMVHTAASSGEMLLSNLVAQGNQKGLKNLLPDAGWFNSCLGNCLLCLGWKIVIFIISRPRSVKKRIIAVLSLFGSCAALMAGESGFPEKGKC